jgi:valyl-tRNA synthetase
MCHLESVVRAGKDASAVSFMVGTTEYAVPLEGTIDVKEEIKKMEDEVGYLEGFLNSVMKKLGNEKFVANAKPEIVANERKKQADAESKIKTLRENIDKLRG